MNKEDYFKYYIQGSDHYLIPRDIFEELFNEMNNWKNEYKRREKKWEKWVTEKGILSSKMGEYLCKYQNIKREYANQNKILCEYKKENQQLKEENKRLEENNSAMQEEMARTWKKLDDLKEIEREHQKINGELREELKYTVPIVEHNKIVSEKNKEIQQVKDVINKAIEYIDNNYPLRTSFSKNIYDFKIEIKKILRGENNG